MPGPTEHSRLRHAQASCPPPPTCSLLMSSVRRSRAENTSASRTVAPAECTSWGEGRVRSWLGRTPSTRADASVVRPLQGRAPAAVLRALQPHTARRPPAAPRSRRRATRWPAPWGGLRVGPQGAGISRASACPPEQSSHPYSSVCCPGTTAALQPAGGRGAATPHAGHSPLTKMSPRMSPVVFRPRMQSIKVVCSRASRAQRKRASGREHNRARATPLAKLGQGAGVVAAATAAPGPPATHRCGCSWLTLPAPEPPMRAVSDPGSA